MMKMIHGKLLVQVRDFLGADYGFFYIKLYTIMYKWYTWFGDESGQVNNLQNGVVKMMRIYRFRGAAPHCPPFFEVAWHSQSNLHSRDMRSREIKFVIRNYEGITLTSTYFSLYFSEIVSTQDKYSAVYPGYISGKHFSGWLTLSWESFGCSGDAFGHCFGAC